jgi:hypothetical protein
MMMVATGVMVVATIIFCFSSFRVTEYNYGRNHRTEETRFVGMSRRGVSDTSSEIISICTVAEPMII